MKPAIVHSEAIAEFDYAIGYYEDQQENLGLDFLTEVEQAIGKIQQNPNLGATYRKAGMRRYVVQRFPFLIFYKEFDEFIWVVAIAHAKRKPNYWRKRQLE